MGNSPKLLVNVGCGYDSGACQFQAAGHTCIHFDMVADMLVALQETAGAISCVAGDANSLPLKKGVFDVLVSVDVIHHEQERVLGLLESFRDLLKPGGRLFLEDPNSWGLFQMHKSILLPKPVHRRLRSSYHRLKRSTHRPADYEFPTSIWQVMTLLDALGFRDVRVHANSAYPNVGRQAHAVYRALSGFEYIRKYHNYHYLLTAVRP